MNAPRHLRVEELQIHAVWLVVNYCAVRSAICCAFGVELYYGVCESIDDKFCVHTDEYTERRESLGTSSWISFSQVVHYFSSNMQKSCDVSINSNAKIFLRLYFLSKRFRQGKSSLECASEQNVSFFCCWREFVDNWWTSCIDELFCV